VEGKKVERAEINGLTRAKAHSLNRTRTLTMQESHKVERRGDARRHL
jgi:hypothetical protein